MNALVGEETRSTSSRYFDAIRRRWLLVLAVTVVCVAAAAIYVLLAPKVYTATADVLVSPISTSDTTLDGFQLLRDSAGPGSSVLTAARLLKTPAAASAVRSRLGLNTSSETLLNQVSAQPVGQANILSVVASSSSADEAARIANAFAAHLVATRTVLFQAQLAQRISELQRAHRQAQRSGLGTAAAAAIDAQLAVLNQYRGQPDPTLAIARPATPPYGPSSPRVGLTLALAFVLALLVGFVAAVGAESFGSSIAGESELRDLGWLPILARVPVLHSSETTESLRQRALPTPAWEAYRLLTVGLGFNTLSATFPRTILVTGSTHGEGKTTVAASLTTALVLEGLTVVAVDGDAGSASSLASAFGEDVPRRDFAETFREPGSTQRASVRSQNGGLRVVDPPVASHPPRFTPLDPQTFKRGLQRLKRTADVVIIDSASPLASADALVMAEGVEMVLVVAHLGHTQRENLSELRAAFARRSPPPAGFVVIDRGKPRYRRSRKRPAAPPQATPQEAALRRPVPVVADVDGGDA